MYRINREKIHKFISRVLCLVLVAASLYSPFLSVNAKETQAGKAKSVRELDEFTMENYISGFKNTSGENGEGENGEGEHGAGEYGEEDYSIVYIRTEEELWQLAENCRLDSWSAGKRIELCSNIELTAENFQIPVFAGIFEGNGYTISGMVFNGKGDNAGFIRYLQEGAQVRNLTIVGEMTQKSSQSTMGGIAGRNFGTITKCRFSGSMNGDTNLGGICGINEKTGVIKDCQNEGIIVGIHSAGGIAGFNHGKIENCRNEGGVNTYLNEVSYGMEDMTLERLEKINSAENVGAHIDIGGIAGISDGFLENCKNQGNIGYEHVGYNVGGIVGRMKQGTVRNCENAGLILGRKDVGGIAGQSEPFLLVEYLEDKLSTLDEELDEMLDLMEILSEEMSKTRQESSGYTKSITKNLHTAADAAGNLKSIALYLRNVYTGETTGMSNDLEQFLKDVENWGNAEDDKDDENDNDNDVIGGDGIGGILSGGDANGENWDDFFGDKWEEDEKFTEYADTVKDFLEKSAAHLKNMTSASSGQTDNMTRNLDILDAAVTEMAEDLETLSAILEEQGEKIGETTDEMVEQAKVLRRLTSEIRDDLFVEKEIEIEDTSEDMAQWDFQDIRQGLLENCVNTGNVQADTCTGGILGQIAIEYDLDPEEDIIVEGDITTNQVRSVRAVVRHCRNEGDVTAKKDQAGGIAGSGNYGILFGCENYGNVKSTGGSTVGGIAGYFAGTISGCYALCEVEGNSRVGGIAGNGNHILYSVSMVEIVSEGKEQGSIAGTMSDEGILYGNCFVDNGTGGVDFVDYLGGAMSIPYGELRAMEGIPERFSHFTVTFLIEGKTAGEVECSYGDLLSAEEFPKIPEKDGCYGYWPTVGKITGR